MVNSSNAQGDEARGVFDRQIDAAVASRQTGYPMTAQEWERLKAHIKNIKPRENLWIAGMSFFGAGAISFGTGAGTLTQVDNVPFPVEVFFFSATFAALAAAVVCFFGCLESSGRRESDTKLAIDHMEDVERIYLPREGAK